MENNNSWFFYNNDIILQSEDPEQLEMANQWILGLKEAIRQQTMEESKMGGQIYPIDNNNNYQDELIGIKISLINTLEQLDFLIDNMQAELAECDCEDGCCK